ncbi:imidazole glycerol phosphate synthase subunit HisH [Tenuifilum thalassicum]|nr:imidazole glycerol phosphate synthase subunit HisH [Tenuifilum thalassicum]
MMSRLNIGIIQYGAGNQASIRNALDKFGVNAFPVSTKEELNKADKLIIPGVGHAKKAMQQLNSLGLTEAIIQTDIPLLGICLGMQLLGRFSAEGSTSCLNICDYETHKFGIKLKIPHMGWNMVKLADAPLFYKLGESEWFYYVHSYYVPKSANTIATSNYEIDFIAAVRQNNFWGVQFHPEKSGEKGLQIIKNFIELC